MMNEEQFLRVV